MIPYLVQYTIRSKQNYIFRTNRLREVTGASVLIADVFQRLLACGEHIGLKIKKADPSLPFSLAETLEAFDRGSLHIAELYQGGGNDTLLVDSADTFRRLNEAFTYELMISTPGMIPLCTGVPVSEGMNYRQDYEQLCQVSALQKSVMLSGQPQDGLPFSMMDPTTKLPLQPEKAGFSSARDRIPAESLAKQNAYLESKWQDETAGELDNLLGVKDSMLAIVHADGNNMGRKLKGLLGEHTDYDTCIQILRDFSQEIDKVFVEDGSAAIEEEKSRILAELKKTNSPFVEIRSMISDGDDYTFICNAKWALRLTKAYLQSVGNHKGYSACAGICLFHRHYPFSRAYDLAEQACESAKKKVHTKDAPDQCWMDFYYLHGGVPDDLDETREEHGTSRCLFRPWRFDLPEDAASIDRLIRLKETMLTASGETGKTTRTNLKTLGAAMEISQSEAAGELRRVFFRAPGLREKLFELFPEEENLLRAIYDLSEIYDLWFDVRGEEQNVKD